MEEDTLRHVPSSIPGEFAREIDLKPPGSGLNDEQRMAGRDIVCDCHGAPMYYFPVCISEGEDFAMCWVSECGRCYSALLGYFSLRTRRWKRARMVEYSRNRVLCPVEHCSHCGFMAVTRSCSVLNATETVHWYCFECETAFAGRDVPALWAQVLQRFFHFGYQRFSLTQKALQESDG